MAPKRPPSPKRSGPEWLRNAGTRADEFARQAVWPEGLPRPPAPSTQNEAEILRRANLAKAGPGLAYEQVASTASPSELAQQSLAWGHARPASFAPQQHVAFVLGRPIMVLMRKTVIKIISRTKSPSSPPG